LTREFNEHTNDIIDYFSLIHVPAKPSAGD